MQSLIARRELKIVLSGIQPEWVILDMCIHLYGNPNASPEPSMPPYGNLDPLPKFG
jgi:hypothetical protein